MHPRDVFSRDVEKGNFCRPALTANMHSSALSTKITGLYYWNGLKVQPSWSSHISLYIITELPKENNLSITPTRLETADTHLESSAPGHPP